MKSEKLKKLEVELQDLEQWLQLGLVPNKDIEKHKKEMALVKKKIDEERARLLALKESGDLEGYSAPKRNAQNRQIYPEHTMPGIDMEDSSNMTDSGVESEDTYETESTTVAGDEGKSEETTYIEEEDDPFSDRNRWRRGVLLEDPDSDAW